MSSEWEIAAIFAPDTTAVGPPSSSFESFDRVMHTVGDRPNTATLPALADPAADHEPVADALSRRADVEEKHRRLRAFMDEQGHEAVVLARADSIAWFTGGGDLGRDLVSERAAVMLYVNHHDRCVVTDNVQSARIFEEEIAGLGFQIKERPWFECPERIVMELGHNKRVASDVPLPPWPTELPRLRLMRLRLTRRERQLYRELGRTLALAVEATCRNFAPGETEADVAGHLAHRLIREGVVPVDLRVASEDRLERFRQPTFKAAPIRRRAMIAVVGRRHGLCAGLTRTVSFGPVEAEFRSAFELASMVGASCLYFSRPGEQIKNVFRRAKRVYEKFGHPDEWMLDYQGCLTGYGPCEGQLRPDCEFTLEPNMALRWNPSVGPARSEDTVVVGDTGYEVVTQAQSWPMLEVTVKGAALPRPSILERPIRG